MRVAPARLRLAYAFILALTSNIALVPAASANPQGPGPQVIYVKATAPPGGSGLSWATAFNSLHDGIQNASAGDTIWVAASTIHYIPPTTGFVIGKQLTLYGGFNGSELTFADRIGDFMGTVLDGNGLADHVVKISTPAGTPSVLLDGFLITGGVANGPAPDDDGAGIHCGDSNVSLAHCFVQNNQANNDGGGIFIEGLDPVGVPKSLRMKVCEFKGNTAGHNGGAIFASRVAGQIVNCSFLQNVAAQHGGAVYHWKTSMLTDPPAGGVGLLFTNVVFQLNHATGAGGSKGGAVCLDVAPGGLGPLAGNAKLVNCTFAQNYLDGTVTPSNSLGEAVFVSGFSPCAIVNSIFWANYLGTPSAIPPPIYPTSGVDVTWSDVEGGYGGPTNILDNPKFRSLTIGGLVLKGPTSLGALDGSPCIDHALYTALPADSLDVDDDGDLGEILPIDLRNGGRFVDHIWVNDQGQPAGSAYLDMGAYETPTP